MSSWVHQSSKLAERFRWDSTMQRRNGIMQEGGRVTRGRGEKTQGRRERWIVPGCKKYTFSYWSVRGKQGGEQKLHPNPRGIGGLYFAGEERQRVYRAAKQENETAHGTEQRSFSVEDRLKCGRKQKKSLKKWKEYGRKTRGSVSTCQVTTVTHIL